MVAGAIFHNTVWCVAAWRVGLVYMHLIHFGCKYNVKVMSMLQAKYICQVEAKSTVAFKRE